MAQLWKRATSLLCVDWGNLESQRSRKHVQYHGHGSIPHNHPIMWENHKCSLINILRKWGIHMKQSIFWPLQREKPVIHYPMGDLWGCHIGQVCFHRQETYNVVKCMQAEIWVLISKSEVMGKVGDMLIGRYRVAARQDETLLEICHGTMTT